MVVFEYHPPAGPVSLEPKLPSASATVTARIMSFEDSNLHGNVHGGAIMKMVDDVAGAVAARHCGGRAVTASMDEMVFLTPVGIGDLVTCQAQVNWAGRTSLEVGVRVTAQRWDDSRDAPRHTASAYLVFVALDADARPATVPPLVLEEATDVRRYAEAEIRRSSRLERRAAIQKARGL